MFKHYTLEDIAIRLILIGMLILALLGIIIALGHNGDTLPQHKTEIYTYFTVYSDRVNDLIVVYKINIDSEYYNDIGCDSIEPDDNGHDCVLWGIDSITDFIIENNLYSLYPNIKER